jgi:trimeric autotransporter adhesin
MLGRVLELRPVTYRFKSGPESAPRTIGLIAQDVEPMFPEAVGEHNGMKSLAYSDLIPVTVGAIQELNQKLEERTNHLQKELKRRDAEIAELSQTVNELKEIVKAMSPERHGGVKITRGAP